MVQCFNLIDLSEKICYVKKKKKGRKEGRRNKLRVKLMIAPCCEKLG